MRTATEEKEPLQMVSAGMRRSLLGLEQRVILQLDIGMTQPEAELAASPC